jgi:hypothetical protein
MSTETGINIKYHNEVELTHEFKIPWFRLSESVIGIFVSYLL